VSHATKAAKAPAADVVQRYWHILRRLPRAPGVITVPELGRALEAEGLGASARTLERDLEKLALRFAGVECDMRTKPFRWRWAKSAESFLVPDLTLEAAVTWELARRHLAHLLPASALELLEPVFEQASRAIETQPSHRMARWARQVEALPPGLPRRVPAVARPVHRAVTRALLEQHTIDVDYRKYGANAAQRYELTPCGLLSRGGLLHLVATYGDDELPRLFSLHRVERAEVTERSASPPRGFKLESFVAEGHPGFRRGSENLRLEAWVDAGFARQLSEAPLSVDQNLSETKGRVRVRATVPDSMELRGFLRSHGPLLEVTKPRWLRLELRTELAQLLARYDGK